ncbi:glycosyltransferase family 1 protein [soil metagenome]
MSTEDPLRVGINARLLYEPKVRGWNRYTMNLLAELPAFGVRPVLYAEAARPVHPVYLDRMPTDSYEVVLSPAMRYPVWLHRWLPRRCKLDRLDLLHSPFNFGLPWSSPCPRVLSLHDAIDIVYYGKRGGWRDRLRPSAASSRLDHWISRTRADRIIAVSEHARGDLVRALGLPAGKVEVIPEAADPVFHQPLTEADRERARRRHDLPGRYVFYVGGWEGRKNIPFLVRAFAGAGVANLRLVLAGGADSQRADLLGLANELGIADRLTLLGWIEDEDLPALYAEALCLAYPSEYEGFGLQLCEAMAVGCPCLAADATSLPEVLGAGGETFPLDSPGTLSVLIRKVAQDEPYRAELSRRARERGQRFSWPIAAEQTADLYRRLLGRGP